MERENKWNVIQISVQLISARLHLVEVAAESQVWYGMIEFNGWMVCVCVFVCVNGVNSLHWELCAAYLDLVQLILEFVHFETFATILIHVINLN